MSTAISYDNYIIAHHLGTDDNGVVFRIPMYPKSVDDSINSKFVETQVLMRSAPLQSYASSGPRKVSFVLEVHRDLDWTEDGSTRVGDIGRLMDFYQALTLPNYRSPQMVVPPRITVKIGAGIRVTGNPNITCTNMLPVDEKGVYQRAQFSFEITETEPYGSTDIFSPSNLSTSIKNARGRIMSNYTWGM